MKDYFVYLPQETGNSLWGCVATAAGYTHIPPHQPYPPSQHPLDHHFKWEEGRVLRSYQIILISAGSGIFESAACPGPQTVEPGTVLVLFPGIWHRYRPARNTGWTEHWLECRGPAPDAALRQGIIHPERSLLRPASLHDWLDYFERCHSLARLDGVANQDLLSTLALHLLALLGHAQRPQRGFTRRIDAVVQRAHTLIAQRCQEPLNPQALAKELGVGYSHLRHSFQSRMGLSLREHYLNTRIQKAQDFLLSSTKSVKEIADLLGFDSASHFSLQFKRRVGQSPNVWRLKHSPGNQPLFPTIS
jgi:AraC-like DNA-binding protein